MNTDTDGQIIIGDEGEAKPWVSPTDTTEEKKCDCYCHKKGAHCCDEGRGTCSNCGEISEWAIRQSSTPSPATQEGISIRNELRLYLPGGLKDFEWQSIEKQVQRLITLAKASLLTEILETIDGLRRDTPLGPDAYSQMMQYYDIAYNAAINDIIEISKAHGVEIK